MHIEHMFRDENFMQKCPLIMGAKINKISGYYALIMR